MKAIYLEKHGGPDSLKYGELPTPVPRAGEVLVKISYSALNHLDLWVREGWPGLNVSFPHILGGDAAGLVESWGEGVQGIKRGQEVIVHPGLACGKCEACTSDWESLCPEYKILGEHVAGTNAEYVCVPTENIFAKPTSLNLAEAASLPLVFTTAWQMIVRRAKVKMGDWVLVHAAGSGVSIAGIQIAKLFGAIVIATSTSEEKLEKAKALGVDYIIPTRSQDFYKEVRKIRPQGPDVIFDHVGKDFWGKNIKLLRSGGTLVTCGATTGGEGNTDLKHVFYRQLAVLGSTMGSKKDFGRMLNHFNTKKLRPVVDKIYPLENAAEAFSNLEGGKQFGKVVIKISGG